MTILEHPWTILQISLKGIQTPPERRPGQGPCRAYASLPGEVRNSDAEKMPGASHPVIAIANRD
jgi:hypothetical protein